MERSQEFITKAIFNLTGEEANVVYFTFPLDLISDANARRILLEGVFQLFGVNTNIAMNEEAKVGKNFSLSDNFPNPFNPETVISWQLAIGSRVELSVYNLLGEKVADLVSRWMDPGNHSYTFNAKNLPSGVYYYQLVAGDYREVKKMVLIR